MRCSKQSIYHCPFTTDEYNNNEKDLIIGKFDSGGSTSGLSTLGVGSRLHGTSIPGGGLLARNTAGGGGDTSTELLSNYKSHPGSVMAGGGGAIITDFDSVSQLSQKMYTNPMGNHKTTSVGMGGGGSGNMTIGDLANLETSDTSVIDYNLVNEEIRYRANLDNMYKKGILLCLNIFELQDSCILILLSCYCKN